MKTLKLSALVLAVAAAFTFGAYAVDQLVHYRPVGTITCVFTGCGSTDLSLISGYANTEDSITPDAANCHVERLTERYKCNDCNYTATYTIGYRYYKHTFEDRDSNGTYEHCVHCGYTKAE